MPYSGYTTTPRAKSVAVPIPDGPVGSAATWKAVFDAMDGLVDVQYGLLEWSGALAVSGAAPNNFTVSVGAITSVSLYEVNDNDYRMCSAGAASVTQSSVEGGGGTLGAAVDWWYVYAYRSTGSSTVLYEVSQTGPDAALVFKSGDVTRRYLGCFRTDASGVPIPVRATRGRYLFRARQAVLTTGNATSGTAVIVRPDGTTEEPLLPDHARVVMLDAVLKHDASANDRTLTLYSNGTGTTHSSITGKNLGAAAYDITHRVDLETDGSRQVGYAVSNASAACELYALGWEE